MFCVLLCTLEAAEGGLCSLEVLEVPEVMRCATLYAGGVGGDALCVALYSGGWALFAGGDALRATLFAGGDAPCALYTVCRGG